MVASLVSHVQNMYTNLIDHIETIPLPYQIHILTNHKPEKKTKNKQGFIIYFLITSENAFHFWQDIPSTLPGTCDSDRFVLA